MVKRKLYKVLSIAVASMTIATTVCPAGVFADEVSELIVVEKSDDETNVSGNGDTTEDPENKNVAVTTSGVQSLSDPDIANTTTSGVDSGSQDTGEESGLTTSSGVKLKAAPLQAAPETEGDESETKGNVTFVTGENIIGYDKFELAATWDASLNVNSDGSAKLGFAGQYKQIFLKLPAGLDSKRITKIEIKDANNKGLCLKIMNSVGENDIKTVYTNVMDIEEGTEFSIIDIMSGEGVSGEIDSSSIAITLAEEKAYSENGTYTFKFNELELDGASAEINGGVDVTVNEDGSALLNFKGQYAQAFFKLPEGINSKRVSKIEFVDADTSSFAVKVLPTPGDDTLADKSGGVTYGNNALNISGLDFAYFAAMSLAEGGGSKTIKEVRITLVDEPVAEDETQVITKKLSEFEIADNSGQDVSEGKVTYDAQYRSIFFAIPGDINPKQIRKIVLKGSVTEDNFAYKIMTEAQYGNTDQKYGDGVAVNYGNPTFEVGNPDVAYLIVMSMKGEAPFGSFSLDSEVEFTLGPAMDVQTDIPNLKDTVVSDDKGLGSDSYVGTCIGNGGMNDEKIVQIVKKHFNAVTLENELKPDSLLNGTNSTLVDDPVFGQVPSALNFTTPDRMLDTILEWNKEDGVNIKVRGHVLTWHSQTPTWFFREGYSSDGAYVSPEVMTKRHEWYIKNVMEHYFSEGSKYKDLFYGFDVVNEACSDGTGTYRSASENSEWAAIYGTGSAEDAPDYILNAFRFANKYAPSTLELYYNDYNDCQSSKVPAIEKLLRSVKKHESDPSLPTRITGFGMQGHHGIDSPSKQQITECTARYGAIVSKVQVTELDVKTSQGYDGSAAAKATEYTKMGYRYKDIYDAYREADRMDGFDVNGFTVWGTIDSVSWLNDANNAGGGSDGSQKQCPLLFDGNYQAKPAFWAIVDSSKLEPFTHNVSSLEAAQGDDVFKNSQSNAFTNGEAAFGMVWDNNGVTFSVVPSDGVDVTKVDLYVNWSGDETAVTPVSTTTKTKGAFVLRSENSGIGIGSKVAFDIVLTLADGSKVAYNNTKLTHESDSKYFAEATFKPFMEIKKGTPVIDGTVDAAWNDVPEVNLTVVGMSPEATAKAKVLWDDAYLYVLMNVSDPELDASASAVHEKDSVEVFIDENNAKSGGYQDDDKQYRINYLNEASFNGTKCIEDNVKHAVSLTDGGYVVEAAFAWTDITPAAGTKIGLDLQINDGKGGARIGTANWYDASGNGWSSPAVFGEATLVDKSSGAEPQNVPGNGDSSNSGSSGSGSSDQGGNNDSSNGSGSGAPAVSLGEVRGMIRAAIVRGGEQTVVVDGVNTITYDIMKLLQDNPGVSLMLRNYSYMGSRYSALIRGRDAVADIKIKWYGPMYLYGKYGVSGSVTTAQPAIAGNAGATSGTYVVKSGDTLWRIARRMHTTVRHLTDTNNIQNPDRIRVGQVIRY